MTKKVTAILLALLFSLTSVTAAFAEELPANVAQTEAITESTAEVTARAGENAVFSVKTVGEVRSYQWQVSKDGGKKWTDLNPKTYGATDTLSIEAKASYDGYLYRCEVTFMDYKVDHSAAAKLSLRKTVAFESEAVGGVKISVEAPEGALPEGTTMKVSAVSQAAVQNAIDKAADLSGIVLAAADITFYADGIVVEPTAPIKVTMTSEAIANAKNPQVVHLDTTAEELEKSLAEPEKVDAKFEQNKVEFEADQFSVYAVLEDGQTGDDARLFVHFKQADGSEIVIPVKKSDIGDNFEMVLYDPGVGTLSGRQTFFGWSASETFTSANTPGMTIDGVRTEVKALLNAGVQEGATVTYYPMLFDVYRVTYLDEDGAGIKTDSILIKSGETETYKINEEYDPKNTDSRFEGWGVATQNSEGKWVLEEGFTLYENETQLTFGGTASGNITTDLVLRAFVPTGYWLIFKENGSGASFTPPAFYRGTPTQPVDDPTRFGYTFGGWYYGKSHTETVNGKEKTVWEIDETRPFSFGSVLEETTRIFAKWNPNTTANYTVIIWTENIACNGYDFKEVVTVQNATVGNNTNVTGAANATTVNIPGGNNKSYTGFHLKETPTNVEITPEGTAVVNVYFDRTEYTFTFQTANGTTIHTVTRKFDQDITDIWEFTGSNGTQYPTSNTSWTPLNSSTYHARITALQRMPAENITWRHTTSNNTARTFHYYVEVPSGETGTRTFQGRQFTLYKDLPNDFNIVVYNDDFWILRGFERLAIAKSGNQVVSLSAGQGIGWDSNNFNMSGVQVVNQTLNGSYGGTNNVLYFYYTRQQYQIHYMDGRYYNGDGVQQEETNRGSLGNSPLIDFDANIASYGKGGANYYTPTDPNGKYVFAGWYADAACNTLYTFDKMPLDGATVYAKWIIKQYRVFLYPNATDKNQTGVGTDDPSFESGDQSTCFRIDYGEEISKIQAIRDEYELGGWYTDPSLKSQYAFSFDSFSASDNTVTTAYDRTESTEKDLYGNVEQDINKDDAAHNDRFWITRKVELYAKWRAKLIGTDGIRVVYESGEDGKFADGTTEFIDPMRYVDTAEAVGQGASTATTEDMEFKQWVLYKWDGSDFVPTDTKVLPGKTFDIDASMAQIVDNATGDPVTKEYVKQHTDGSYTYTIKLVAEYGSIEAPTPTHIYWYRNWEGDTSSVEPLHKDEPVQINIGVKIYTLDSGETLPTRPGYKFVGWARETEVVDGAVVGYYANPTLYLKLVEDDSTLGYHYEVQRGTEWKTVTEVAADENQPYHGMYAVWEQTSFFVYHSATGKLEAVDMSTLESETYDLTAKVTEGYLYGGHFTAFGGVTAENVEAAKKAALSAENLTATVADFEAYDGKALKISDGTKRFWTKGEHGLEAGNAITPVVDTVYYLKEVPNVYLATNARWVYDTIIDNKILNLFLLTAVDDTFYTEVKFTAGGKDYASKLVTSFSYQMRTSDAVTKITPTDLIGQRGYLGIVDITNKISEITSATATNPFILYPSWTTLDGVTIKTNGYKFWCTGDVLSTDTLKYEAIAP